MPQVRVSVCFVVVHILRSMAIQKNDISGCWRSPLRIAPVDFESRDSFHILSVFVISFAPFASICSWKRHQCRGVEELRWCDIPFITCRTKIGAFLLRTSNASTVNIRMQTAHVPLSDVIWPLRLMICCESPVTFQGEGGGRGGRLTVPNGLEASQLATLGQKNDMVTLGQKRSKIILNEPPEIVFFWRKRESTSTQEEQGSKRCRKIWVFFRTDLLSCRNRKHGVTNKLKSWY